ncbi:MAG: hypothetical protein E6J41_21170 [Chloroflexi bacterium]|nr:MAG: hypothetical protein E6J41_21170 [Chloroflexota bacterium]
MSCSWPVVMTRTTWPRAASRGASAWISRPMPFTGPGGYSREKIAMCSLRPRGRIVGNGRNVPWPAANQAGGRVCGGRFSAASRPSSITVSTSCWNFS